MALQPITKIYGWDGEQTIPQVSSLRFCQMTSLSNKNLDAPALLFYLFIIIIFRSKSAQIL